MKITGGCLAKSRHPPFFHRRLDPIMYHKGEKGIWKKAESSPGEN